MQLDELVATDECPGQDVSHLTPDERRREIASLLATGILRLLTRRGTLPETPAGGPERGSSEISDSVHNCLDASATKRTHVHAV
jgi:hypothetical protein